MLPTTSINDSGDCTLSLKTNEISLTYYFENNNDLFDLGIALLKNSLISKIKVENNLEIGETTDVIEKFISSITQNLKDDLTFQNKIEQHEIYYSDSESDIKDDSPLITDDESNDEILNITKSMEKSAIISDDED
ncbi:hypothetical protein IIV30_053R [Invertebrate iridescent virus 30]|uniref:Uncharacterized protein n=1 Tax=Invertebrate iridescent virus 30 TaxID=345585 RepID=W8W1Q7_9VIRU|nr:hypothetical protein IIV30_053R [Invertebrate iridescent virus 30]CCV02248.1 hypothetical protein IIV30_053R [Invertebrate iridescent virus 30]